MVNPLTMIGLAQGLSNAGGAMSQQPGVQSVFTPEMLQNAINSMNKYMSEQNALGRTPFYGAGGVTTQQGGKLDPKEIKVREYAKFLETKGYDPQNAFQRAQQIAGSSKEKFKDDKEFSRFVKSGQAQGLSKKGGKIKAGTEFAPGGFGVADESELMRSAMSNLGLQSLSAASGLPQAYADEARRALAARQGLQGQVQGLLAGGPGASGLYSTQEEALENLKNKYLNDFQSVYTDTMRRATSDLTGSGFSSSSLAGEYMKDNAYDTQSDFLTDALAKLAGQESTFLSQASGIGAQNLNNVLNSFNTLGANQGMGSVLGGVMNPGSAGLFTDPQSAALAAQIQQSAIGNRRADQGMMNQVNTMPVSVMGSGPGFFGTLANIAAPMLGGAAWSKFANQGKEKNV